MIFAATLVLSGCGNQGKHGDTAGQPDSIHYISEKAFDETDEGDGGDDCFRTCKDSVILNNGIKGIRVTGYGPMNVFVLFSNQKGQPLIISSQASETEAQILTFTYDHQGRIAEVSESYSMDAGGLEPDAYARIASADGNKAYDYRFKYDGRGNLTEVTRIDQRRHPDAEEAETVKANKGTHLEGDFRPVEDFWMSDLQGGRMDICLREAPDRPAGKGTRPRKWINFEEADEIGMLVEFGDYYWNLPEALTF